MEVDRNGLEVLDRVECLRLLRSTPVGRLGFSTGALPTILPVNYVVDGDRLLVRTGPGSKLDAAIRNAVVAFEADEVDEEQQLGWSVVVTGMASEAHPDDGRQADLSSLDRWAPQGDGRVLAISLDVMSGRRLVESPDGSRPDAPTPHGSSPASPPQP
jgi:nitroimidazol reductase NimA-like FMN-containing flavoprotein (pyridoxamine 5'-phosphate oxidase superfamily)